MRTLRTAAFAALFAGLAVGCGSSNTPASIKGKVTYKGQPLPGGGITFTGDGGSYPGSINSDGTYAVKDVPVGNFAIIVETESVNPKGGTSADDKDLNKKNKQQAKGIEQARQQRMKEEGIGGGGGGGGGGFGPAPPEVLAAMYLKIPAKYSDKRTSGLRMDVVRGEQTKDIELTD